MFCAEAVNSNLRAVLESHLKSYAKYIGVPIDELTSEHFQVEFIDAFKESELKRGKAPNSINANLTTIRRFLRFLDTQGVMSDSALLKRKAIKNLHVPTLPIEARNAEYDIEASILCCDDNSLAGLRDAAVLSLLLYQKLTRAQICRAEYSDLKDGQFIVKNKTGRESNIDLDDRVTELLNEYVEDFRGVEPGPLFLSLNKNGDPRPGMKSMSPPTVNLIKQKRCVIRGD